MTETTSKVIIIPANPELAKQKAVKRQLRVAAYCRVSTDDEEQLTSYEAQQVYYTDKIMSNPEWTMVDVFADRGITGTSARKRPEFLRMIRLCRQKKVDIVLTKSISRFARNTVDCLKYIRALRELGIAIIFEKENINTLEADSEILITMLGAFAQAESESMSANIVWGKRQAMRDGKVTLQYRRLYGYRKGADGNPEIIPEQAEVVRRIYDQYLAGASLRQIKTSLEADNIPQPEYSAEWTLDVIKGILTSEKYRGDALMQKTFIKDCISKKVVRNNGQLPMYLAQNNHPAIIDRHIHDAVQAEMARRNAGRSPSKKNASTGRTSYASRYALSERLVCGECGTLYRRCVWVKRGKRRVVWRCVSRLDYGTKYCHNSPTLDEEPLQRAILAAINEVMDNRDELAHEIASTMELELAPIPGQTISLADIQRGINDLEGHFNSLLEQAAEQIGSQDYMAQFQKITNDIAALKAQRSRIEEQRKSSATAVRQLDRAVSLLKTASPDLIEWNESFIRQLVDTVKVLSENTIVVYLRGGIEIQQNIEK